MRILLVHHFPLEVSAGGSLIRRLLPALTAAGHQTRVLNLAESRRDEAEPGLRTLVCNRTDPAADLPFDLPRFSTEGPGGGIAFATLSTAQLNQYREAIRRGLDVEIAGFNPDVIHAQHIWVQGQLALETGVPYLLNAWGAELIDYGADQRFQALADQAAENAGRILVTDDALRNKIVGQFPSAAERVVAISKESPIDHWIAQYEAVLHERFGDR